MIQVIRFILFLCIFPSFYGQEANTYNFKEVSSAPYFEELPCATKGTEECFNNQIKAHTVANFDYPKSALENQLTGIVYVQFVVDSTGVISNIRTRSLEKVFENEGLRIVEAIPKLQPAILDGNPVAMIYSYPIEFNLILNDEIAQKPTTLLVDADAAVGSTDIVSYNAAPVPPLFQGCEREKDWSACFNAKMEENFIKQITTSIRPYGNIHIKAKVYFEINKKGEIVNPIVVSENKKVIEILTKYLYSGDIAISAAKNAQGSAIDSYFNYDLSLAGIRRSVKTRN
ncbi:energy transducer TonB [Muriicola sp. SD30]|uniref:energy transducer TonB n=1 Tax=Muriicola sp. SD30 TaxID=3240936 RepID=UPI00350F8FD5